MGISAKGKGKHTDGRVWVGPFCPKRVAFDVSIVNPTAVSHSGAGACAESFLDPNAGTGSAERTKTDTYKLLCQQRGMDFVPIVFTNEWGEQSLGSSSTEREYWNPMKIQAMNFQESWTRVRKRKAFWEVDGP